MRSPVPLIVALCLLCVVFAWKTQQAWFSSSLTAGASERLDVGVKSDEPGVYPRRDYTGMVASIQGRPLFRPDRMSLGAGDESAGETFEQILSHMSMIGVMTFGENLKGIVIAVNANESELMELEAGDSLMGFKVKSVMEDGITMTAGGKEFLLPLYSGPPQVDERSLRTDLKPARKQGASPNQPGARRPPGVGNNPNWSPQGALRPGVPARQQQSQTRDDEDNSGENQ